MDVEADSPLRTSRHARSLLAYLRCISFRRWSKLLGGLACFGIGVAFMKQADLGLGPWEVLNDGLAKQFNQKIGTASIVVGAIVLLLWIPMKEKPGIGTVLNMILVGTFTNVSLLFIGIPEYPVLWGIWLLGGVVLIGLGSALYLGSHLGAGPRDGMMLALHRKTGWSLRLTRTLIEILALTAGYVLGGTVGIGTLVFAFSIGPIMQLLMKLLGQSVIPAAVLPTA